MWIKLYRANFPFQQILLVLILSLLFWINAFYRPVPPVFDNRFAPLYQFVFSKLVNTPFWSVALAWIFILLQAWAVNYYFSSFDLITRNSGLSLLAYVIFMSVIPGNQTLNPLLVSNFFIIGALLSLFHAYKEEEPYTLVMNAGIFIALASLFYFPSLLYFFILWIGLLVFRIYSWREWVIVFLGTLAPFLFIATYYFWFDKWELLIQHYKTAWDSLHIGYIVLSKTEWTTAIFLVLIFIPAWLYTLNHVGEKIISIRKLFAVLNWFFIISIVILIFSGHFMKLHLVFFALPVSAFAGFHWSGIKKLRWHNWLLSACIIWLIVKQFIPFISL